MIGGLLSGMPLLRVGLVVPNLTVETELPVLLLRHDVNFSFRSVRVGSAAPLGPCDVAVVVSDTAPAPDDVPVVRASAALVDGLVHLGARRIAIVTAAASSATARLVSMLDDTGVSVVDAISLGVTDEEDAARLSPARLVGLVSRLALEGADAVVLAPCGRMPTLSAIEELEHRFDLPVVSATTAVARALLDHLALAALVPGGGALLR